MSGNFVLDTIKPCGPLHICMFRTNAVISPLDPRLWQAEGPTVYSHVLIEPWHSLVLAL